MTNTNDFRRYSYRNDTSYLIGSFDISRGSQAPKIRPESAPERELKVHENKKVKSKSQIKAEQRIAFNKAVRIAVIAVVCLSMVGLLLNSMATKNELTREISQKQTQIANAKSENISLQSELDAMVSVSMIDEYAVDKLGMSKVKSNQIQYMDVNQYNLPFQQTLLQNDTICLCHLIFHLQRFPSHELFHIFLVLTQM